MCSLVNNTDTVLWYFGQDCLVCRVERSLDDDRIVFDIMYDVPIN